MLKVGIIGAGRMGRGHISVYQQLEREGYPAPKVTLDDSITDFYQFTKDSFRVENYQYHPFDFEIPMAI